MSRRLAGTITKHGLLDPCERDRPLPGLRDDHGGVQDAVELPRASLGADRRSHARRLPDGARRPVPPLARQHGVPLLRLGRRHPRSSRRSPPGGSPTGRSGGATLVLGVLVALMVVPPVVLLVPLFVFGAEHRADLDVPPRDPDLRRADAAVLGLHADELLPHHPGQPDRGGADRRGILVAGVQADRAADVGGAPDDARASSTCSGSGTSC